VKKETFVCILFCGVLACGWVFGRSLSDSMSGGVSGAILAFISAFIGMIMWGILSRGERVRRATFRESAVKGIVSRAVEGQRRSDRDEGLVFGEALARKCVVRMVSMMAQEEGRAHLFEQADAVIEEEVEAVRRKLAG